MKKKEKAAAFPLPNQLLRTLMMLISLLHPIIYLLKFGGKRELDDRMISEVLAYYFSLSTEKGPGVGSFLAVLAL